MEIKVSIIVPIYNVERYLTYCVDSLLNQDFNQNYEIILVDDGSLDKSGIIADNFAKQYDNVSVIHKKILAYLMHVTQVLKKQVGNGLLL